jgi:hypothetical protein
MIARALVVLGAVLRSGMNDPGRTCHNRLPQCEPDSRLGIFTADPVTRREVCNGSVSRLRRNIRRRRGCAESGRRDIRGSTCRNDPKQLFVLTHVAGRRCRILASAPRHDPDRVHPSKTPHSRVAAPAGEAECPGGAKRPLSYYDRYLNDQPARSDIALTGGCIQADL